VVGSHDSGGTRLRCGWQLLSDFNELTRTMTFKGKGFA
jgi:hypothetical protein